MCVDVYVGYIYREKGKKRTCPFDTYARAERERDFGCV